MNIDHKEKSFNKPLDKSTNNIFTVILLIIAIVIGIQSGNILYKLDLHVIGNIDSENFRHIIDLSFPIIKSVYNSGKSSVSFSGEVKELLTKIFDFDLDSPTTILNAESPLFASYYKSQSLRKKDIIDNSLSRLTIVDYGIGNNGTQTGNGGNTGNGSSGSNDPSGSGDNSANTANNTDGNNSGSKLPGQLDGTPESSMSYQTDYSTDKTNGLPGQTGNIPGQNSTGANQQFAQGSQPISSISYEVEDEKEGDEKETVELNKIQIKNFTKHKIDIAALLKKPLDIDLSKKGPKVLIYHTHTTESYVLKEADLGNKDTPSHNSNPKYNVVRVGEELARYLEKYGIDTLHNGTVHDKDHDSAYGVSINTIQSYKKSYPSIQVYIDIHRDAVDSDKPKLRMTKQINGKNCAQIMFVVGADGVLPHPKWQENLKFVLKLQQKLNEKYPGLARPVWIVGKRYNQQVSNQSILIEVGGDGNLLSECLESTKYLAEVLNDVMREK